MENDIYSKIVLDIRHELARNLYSVVFFLGLAANIMVEEQLTTFSWINNPSLPEQITIGKILYNYLNIITPCSMNLDSSTIYCMVIRVSYLSRLLFATFVTVMLYTISWYIRPCYVIVYSFGQPAFYNAVVFLFTKTRHILVFFSRPRPGVSGVWKPRKPRDTTC